MRECLRPFFIPVHDSPVPQCKIQEVVLGRLTSFRGKIIPPINAGDEVCGPCNFIYPGRAIRANRCNDGIPVRISRLKDYHNISRCRLGPKDHSRFAQQVWQAADDSLRDAVPMRITRVLLVERVLHVRFCHTERKVSKTNFRQNIWRLFDIQRAETAGIIQLIQLLIPRHLRGQRKTRLPGVTLGSRVLCSILISVGVSSVPRFLPFSNGIADRVRVFRSTPSIAINTGVCVADDFFRRAILHLGSREILIRLPIQVDILVDNTIQFRLVEVSLQDEHQPAAQRVVRHNVLVDELMACGALERSGRVVRSGVGVPGEGHSVRRDSFLVADFPNRCVELYANTGEILLKVQHLLCPVGLVQNPHILERWVRPYPFNRRTLLTELLDEALLLLQLCFVGFSSLGEREIPSFVSSSSAAFSLASPASHCS